MITLRRTMLAAGVLAAATAVAAVAPTALAAQAAQAAPDASATVGDLVLAPTDRGYRGALPIEVTNHGAEPAAFVFVVTEPIRGSYDNPDAPMECNSSRLLEDLRQQIECPVPGGDLQPGEVRPFAVDFAVLTAIRPHAMTAPGGQIEIRTGEETVLGAAFETLFRSSTGSVADPRPYVRDERPDVTITAGDATLLRQADGSFAGRAPVTVRYNGDAAHYGHLLEPVMPAGVEFVNTDPADGCPHFCVPGGAFMQGEERTLDLLLTAPAGTQPGPLGEATVSVRTELRGDAPDVDPSDNVASFQVTIAQ